ncbi:MAG TPA: PIG-L family deacetylase, partial [Chthoniobacterales bacterium]
MRILAIGAHPDDIEFACGGILLVERERGSDVKLCLCSRGEAGTNGTPDEREAEARRAADLLSAEIVFLECGGDSHIAQTNENAFRLAREIRRGKPDIVLSSITTEDQ